MWQLVYATSADVDGASVISNEGDHQLFINQAKRHGSGMNVLLKRLV